MRIGSGVRGSRGTKESAGGPALVATVLTLLNLQLNVGGAGRREVLQDPPRVHTAAAAAAAGLVARHGGVPHAAPQAGGAPRVVVHAGGSDGGGGGVALLLRQQFRVLVLQRGAAAAAAAATRRRPGRRAPLLPATRHAKSGQIRAEGKIWELTQETMNILRKV